MIFFSPNAGGKKKKKITTLHESTVQTLQKNNNQQQPISIRGNTFNYINLGGGAAHVTLGHCYF